MRQDVQCGVVITMQAHTTLWATAPAHRQALRDHDAAARTHLTGERTWRSDGPPNGACCPERQVDQQCRPPCIAAALRALVILDHVVDLQVFMIDRVMPLNKVERCLVMKVPAPPLYRHMGFGE
jgi:hypothetical protein